MSRRHHPERSDQLRRAVAQEAARLMAEHGIHDFLTAKRKAAERYGLTENNALPKNAEIEQALAEYQRLFEGESHGESLYAQRLAALEAMRLLRPFSPRLVGAVLSGTATAHSDVQLHLFTDNAESVAIKLLDDGIPYEVTEHKVRMSPERVIACPGVRFDLDDQSIEATVFPTDGIRQSPPSPVDGKPMKRAGYDELAAMLKS